ncbi:MAG: sle2 [Frankiales bacterium]|nr:sle2 [Frankiales bacterium]
MSAADKRRLNQAAHWNARQAAATTPQEVVAVWFDACRMVARRSEKEGHPEVWPALASHLHDFFQRHAQ